MDVDSLYFSSLLKSRKVQFLKGVESSFFDKEWEPVFTFVRKFNSRYGRLPRLGTVKDKFKDKSFLKAVEPTPFYGRELRTRHAFGLLEEGLRTDYTPMRSANNLDGSVDALKGVILTIERLRQSGSKGILRLNQHTTRRKNAYKKRKKMKGLLGIKTPWLSLDAVTQGWQPGDLIVVLARAGIGKSFFVLLNALSAMYQSKNTLVSSMEMFPERLGIRFDGLGAKVSVDRFRKGKLLKQESKRMARWYKQLEQDKSLGFVDLCGPNEISSPLDLELHIQLGNYELAIWDSFYLASKKKKWEEFAQLVADLKKVAVRCGVPLIITSQFNKDVKGAHTKADQVSAAFTDSILHDADFVFALFQTPTMKVMKEMLLRSLKVREGIELNELLLKWDIDKGDFSEIISSVGIGEPAEDELDKEVDLELIYS